MHQNILNIFKQVKFEEVYCEQNDIDCSKQIMKDMAKPTFPRFHKRKALNKDFQKLVNNENKIEDIKCKKKKSPYLNIS